VLLNGIYYSSSGGGKEHWRPSRVHACCQTAIIVESRSLPALEDWM
jgi:hypothetical protein